MIRTIIIDDEDNARNNLQAILADNCPNVEVAEMQGTVADGIKAIKKHKPDLVFLDVKMQGETGFDLLKGLDEHDFELIFTTAHDEYALKAFKFSAIDYLLKPIDIDELKNAVDKVEDKLSSRNSKARYDLMVNNLKSTNGSFEKIALPTTDGLIFVQRKNIVRCESADNYTTFYLINGEKILVSKTIKYYEELLLEYNFFRVHQSHLINLNHLKQYHKGEGGYAVMTDDSAVIISRRKKESFLKQLV